MRTLTAPRPRFCAGVLALLAALAAPACSSDSGDADVAGGAGVGAPGDPSGGDGFGINGQDDGEPMPPPPTITPSGLLLLPQERLEAIETLVAAGDPRWLSFKNQTDEWLGDIDINMASPENGALMYRITGDAAYAETAYQFAVERMSADVRSGQYLEFGNLMRHAAMVLNLCGDALSPDQKQTLIDYLVTWTNELWFDNQGAGWGLDDSGNNYHMAFLQGTAYAGYALREAGHPDGQKFIDLLHDKLEREGGVFDYLAEQAKGGAWHEGINYGERAMQRLADALAVIASMDGVNHFYDHPFFVDVIYFTAYALQNDKQSFHPAGDLARDPAMQVTPAVRDYLQTIASYLPDMKAKRLAIWLANEVSPDYETPGYRIFAFRELALGLEGEGMSFAELPLSYHATGHGFLNFRSGWGPSDVSLTVSAPTLHDQSHQHIDAGSFVIFKDGWQALDATTLSGSGLNQSSAAHNTIHVFGSENRLGDVGGVIGAIDAGSYAYVGLDGTNQYRYRPDGAEDGVTMLDEFTRELVYLRPGTVVIYDRVDAKPGHDYDWRLHTATAPVAQGQVYEAVSEGQRLSVRKLIGGAQSVAQDGDLPGGPSEAYRVVTAATGETSRFLHVVSVGEGAAPDATAITGDKLAGALVGDHAIVFSSEPRGASPGAMSYTVPAQPGRVHLIGNQSEPVTVSLETNGGQTTVTVTPGGSTTPNEAGVVEINE